MAWLGQHAMSRRHRVGDENSPCQSAVNHISSNTCSSCDGPRPMASNAFGLLFCQDWFLSHNSCHVVALVMASSVLFGPEKQKLAAHAVFQRSSLAHAVSLHSHASGCRSKSKSGIGRSCKEKSISSGSWLIVELYND